MKALPSLRQLEFLAALDEHGHFGHAAAACGVSQSTFSAGFAELEQQLGVALAERDRRKVLVTATGRRDQNAAIFSGSYTSGSASPSAASSSRGKPAAAVAASAGPMTTARRVSTSKMFFSPV